MSPSRPLLLAGVLLSALITSPSRLRLNAETPDASPKPAESTLAPRETPAEHDARMGWFRDARFGLFIHWGVYSVPAGEWNGKTNYGEWFLEETKMPVSQYEKFAAAVQSREVRRRGVGAPRQGRRA